MLTKMCSKTNNRCSLICPPCPPPQIPSDPSYPCPTSSIITMCSLPPMYRCRPKLTCKAYFPKIKPIKAVRFASATYPPHGCGQWTNLTYHPIIQGGLSYYGVEKLVPCGPPPGPPVLCRPVPIKPSNSSGMVVYSSP